MEKNIKEELDEKSKEDKEIELDEELKKIETYEQLNEWEKEERQKIRLIHSNYRKKIKKVKIETIISTISTVAVELVEDWVMYTVIRSYDGVKDPHIAATILWGIFFSAMKVTKYMMIKAIFNHESDEINEIKKKEEEATDPVFDEFYNKKCLLENRVYKKYIEKNS